MCAVSACVGSACREDIKPLHRVERPNDQSNARPSASPTRAMPGRHPRMAGQSMFLLADVFVVPFLARLVGAGRYCKSISMPPTYAAARL